MRGAMAAVELTARQDNATVGEDGNRARAVAHLSTLSASQASSVPKTNARMPHSDSRSSPCASGPTRVESGFYARRRALFDKCSCGSFNSHLVLRLACRVPTTEEMQATQA